MFVPYSTTVTSWLCCLLALAVAGEFPYVHHSTHASPAGTLHRIRASVAVATGETIWRYISVEIAIDSVLLSLRRIDEVRLLTMTTECNELAGFGK